MPVSEKSGHGIGGAWLQLAALHIQTWGGGDHRRLGKLGGMQMSLGHTPEAIEAFRAALKCDPNSLPALANLNRLKPFERTSQKARKLKSLVERGDLPARERAMGLNALGRIEERAGRHRAAFRHFTRCNALCDGSRWRSRACRRLLTYAAPWGGCLRIATAPAPARNPPLSGRFIHLTT